MPPLSPVSPSAGWSQRCTPCAPQRAAKVSRDKCAPKFTGKKWEHTSCPQEEGERAASAQGEQGAMSSVERMEGCPCVPTAARRPQGDQDTTFSGAPSPAHGLVWHQTADARPRHTPAGP